MNAKDVSGIAKKWRGRAAGKDIQKLVDHINTLEKDLENAKNSLQNVASQPAAIPTSQPRVCPSGLDERV